MGETEREKTLKSVKLEKPVSPPRDQSSVHVYPDWARLQAYYGAGVVSAAYYNPAVAPSHVVHPYMWAQPQMVPPYGSHYAAVYPHEGMYGASAAPACTQVTTPLTLETPTRFLGNNKGSAMKSTEADVNAVSGNRNAESGVMGESEGEKTLKPVKLEKPVSPPRMVPPYGSHYAAVYAHEGMYGASAAPVVTTPLTLETRTRSSENNNGSAKKPNEADVDAASVNRNAESAVNGGPRGQSHSTDCGTEGSCDRSDESTAREYDSGRSYNGASDSGTCNMQTVPGVPMDSTKSFRSFLKPEMNHSNGRANGNESTPAALRPCSIDVQDERALKREKRKQANRESARRSRLKKQAEMDDLGRTVDALTAENLAIRLEINKLMEDSKKRKSENGLLMEMLKDMQGQAINVICKTEDGGNSHVKTENL
ncbi:hypothetical protein vseg_011937 [Gypsophila vaccaria]